MEEITSEQFHAYERVRQSGKTNMMLWWEVQTLAMEDDIYLSREVILQIITEYAALAEKFKEADGGEVDEETAGKGDRVRHDEHG